VERDVSPSSSRNLSAVLLALGFSLLPFAAGAQTPGAAIVVYNAQHANLTQAWADGFTKETGIKVTLRQGSDTLLGNQIIQEGSASPADVFVTENSPAMTLVDAAGLFAPLFAGNPQGGASQLPAVERALDRGCGADDRLCLQQGQGDPGQAAEVASRPCRSQLEGPLGRGARRR